MIDRQQRTIKQRLMHVWNTHAGHIDMVYATALLYILAIIVLAVQIDPYQVEGIMEDSTYFSPLR